MDALDVHLHVGEGLGVAVHVPLAQPHPQLFRPEDNFVKEVRGITNVNLNLLTQCEAVRRWLESISVAPQV